MRKIFHPDKWKHSSPDSVGLHGIILPDSSECRTLRAFRLNLKAGAEFQIGFEELELNAALIQGKAAVLFENKSHSLARFDSFYLPGGREATLTAESDLTAYFGAAPYENCGDFFIRRFDRTVPLGSVRQIHGQPPYEREIFMTLDPATPASRLIAGFTWSCLGAWTSWPPHQHEKNLEEVYCYFDLPDPFFGLHLSYLKPSDRPCAHIVHSGDFVEAPAGYHPTVAIPGSRNAYFWVLAAHSRESRRYDLAIEDSNYSK